MHVSARILAALSVALLGLLLLTSAALAGTPATVTVRVLGQAPAYEALTPPTLLTTTTALVTRDQGSCSGTSAAGALELGTGGDWEGIWSAKYSDYEVVSIDGHSYPFEEGAPANYYWSFWHDNAFAEVGVCEAELQNGDQVLFVPSCYGEHCPPSPTQLLSVEAPSAAEAGAATTVTVRAIPAAGGNPAPVAGVSVSAAPAPGTTGGGSVGSVVTDAEGHATLTFASAGSYILRAAGTGEPRPIPGEVGICVHRGDDGTCGTPTPSSGPSIQPVGKAPAVLPYTGPYPLVGRFTDVGNGHFYSAAGAPRLLSGEVVAHASVTSISLELHRSYRGRCWAYDGARERLQRARCGHGRFFKVASGGERFSYLLPARLPAGRYVLDVSATDAVGNHAPLDRGSSRVVFYVE